ncbi:MAG: phosphodiesterase [Clostridia bacterium]|nr:phosphodiesterase [Clostridia bacterium]
MKWFIASDIHGSAYYAKKMIEAYKREQADKMLLLGDILYHGPRNDLPRDYAPKKVIPLLNAEKERILCVRGNCDAEVDQMVLDFPIMDDFVLIEDGGVLIFATHGHVYNEEKLPDGEFDILLHGHTHVPKITDHEKYVYINPGSVSIPKEDSHHGYMIFEQGRFLWKDFDGKILKEYYIK